MKPRSRWLALPEPNRLLPRFALAAQETEESGHPAQPRKAQRARQRKQLVFPSCAYWQRIRAGLRKDGASRKTGEESLARIWTGAVLYLSRNLKATPS